ncbi:efflux transporter outer membrane subunit [Fluviispira multicolorata]|uniref:Efflux transporter outer membrane subunit n=1 Tax=Fluviispira multicolorata TaxID=2654512 RepID=A0A833N5B8_9BACT|nr:efflux transporter outer membrane subunit [Fluviispira multicolorata]KAB8033667.1 efflux transporter outer membrane subunit [Fluviispira multicolorata]
MSNLKFIKFSFIKIQIFIYVFLLFLISSCAVGPDYKKPTFEISEQFKEIDNKNWKLAEPKDEQDKGKWWEIFADTTLNEFEEELLINSNTIASAMAQYEQAQTLVSQAQAGLLPTLNASGGVSRQRSQANSNLPASYSTNYSTSLSASWIPDLWGNVRRSIEANKANAEASSAQLANVKLTAQASLAQYYFQLRTADINQKLLEETVENYKKTLEITEHLRISGTATLSDYLQAEAQVSQAEALSIDNKISRQQYEHAIAILLGKNPAKFSVEVKHIKLIPPEIPLFLPSELLERRPDIAQAERLVAQANAQIGVAISAYFPNLNLSTAAGYSSSTYSNLFSLPALFWSLGASLSETIFDGGLREAKIESAKANYKSLVAQYKQTVLIALQNVEDNLVAMYLLKKEEEAQNNAAFLAQQAENLTTQSYEVGTQTYNNVILSQTNTLAAQKSANNVLGRRMTTAVSLIAALGGGWKMN